HLSITYRLSRFRSSRSAVTSVGWNSSDGGIIRKVVDSSDSRLNLVKASKLSRGSSLDRSHELSASATFQGYHHTLQSDNQSQLRRRSSPQDILNLTLG